MIINEYLFDFNSNKIRVLDNYFVNKTENGEYIGEIYLASEDANYWSVFDYENSTLSGYFEIIPSLKDANRAYLEYCYPIFQNIGLDIKKSETRIKEYDV